LPGPVEGDPPAPVTLHELDAASPQLCRAGKDVGRISRAPDGDDRRVLEKHQEVPAPARSDALLDQGALPAQGLAILKREGADELQLPLGHL